MKLWQNAEIVDLAIEETAYGKNLNAKERNANKHDNNGAGGSLMPGGDDYGKDDTETSDPDLES